MGGPAGAPGANAVGAAARSLALRFLEGGAPAPPEPAAAVADAALACVTPSEVAFNGRLLRAEAGAPEAAATVGAGAAAAGAVSLLPPLWREETATASAAVALLPPLWREETATTSAAVAAALLPPL